MCLRPRSSQSHRLRVFADRASPSSPAPVSSLASKLAKRRSQPPRLQPTGRVTVVRASRLRSTPGASIPGVESSPLGARESNSLFCGSHSRPMGLPPSTRPTPRVREEVSLRPRLTVPGGTAPLKRGGHEPDRARAHVSPSRGGTAPLKLLERTAIVVDVGVSPPREGRLH